MAGVRRLRPDEYDLDGFPAFNVSLEFLSHDLGGGWFAHCPKLPGYWGAGKTREGALKRLEAEFAKAAVCMVPRVKFDDADATRRLLLFLREQGGSDAPSEALKPRIGPNEKPLGFSQSDLFKARSQLREAEQMLGVKIPMTDLHITMAANYAAGVGGWVDSQLIRHQRAKARIIEFLRTAKGTVSDKALLIPNPPIDDPA